MKKAGILAVLFFVAGISFVEAQTRGNQAAHRGGYAPSVSAQYHQAGYPGGWGHAHHPGPVHAHYAPPRYYAPRPVYAYPPPRAYYPVPVPAPVYYPAPSSSFYYSTPRFSLGIGF